MTAASRIMELPDVTTLAEAGVPDVLAGSWFALLAPARTPLPSCTSSKRLAGKLQRPTISGPA